MFLGGSGLIRQMLLRGGRLAPDAPHLRPNAPNPRTPDGTPQTPGTGPLLRLDTDDDTPTFNPDALTRDDPPHTPLTENPVLPRDRDTHADETALPDDGNDNGRGDTEDGRGDTDGRTEPESPNDPEADPPYQHADTDQGGGRDGTALTPSHHRPGTYDPHAPIPETIPPKDAPTRYTQDDVQDTLDNAPQNEFGQPVDPRNGRPLLLENSNGDRGWVMRWDPDNETWIAENRGLNEHGLAQKGEPGAYGYDDNGDLLPYANHRPDYAKGQVEEVWENSRAEQLQQIDNGALPLERPGDNQLWVRARDNAEGDDLVDLGQDGKWRLIEWEPGQPRDGLWDMGHTPEAKYSTLRERYLNHEISLERFLQDYRNSKNYLAEDPSRNRSHDNEL